MSRSGARARVSAGPPSARMVVWVASLGAAMVTSGVQGITPAIPVIQEQFGLSTAQVALITSVYLFPGIFSAFAAGILGEKIGSRAVFAGALGLFGLGAVVLLLEHSLSTLLIVRFVQGIAFGAVLSFSVGLIGGVAPSGPAAARGQSRRIIAMASAEAGFPIVAGLMLGLAWYAPFYLQLLALPLAVVTWVILPAHAAVKKRGSDAPAKAAFQAPAILGVQTLAALRFVFKFAVMTYFPLLAVDNVGMTPVMVGYLMGISAALSAVSAALTERLAARWRSSELIFGCLAVIAVCLAVVGLGDVAVVVAIGLLVYGIQDGVYGVAHNVLANEMAPVGARVAYIGLTGTVRNVGKFAAPLLFGAVTLLATIPQAFVVFAGTSAVSTLVARNVVRKQARLEGDAAPDGG